MSVRGETLHRIDAALAELSALEASLTAARRGQRRGIDRSDAARRFHAVARAGAGDAAFAPVQELAALAGKVTDGTERSILHTAGEFEVVQHATDVLSLLLRDMGYQLLGRRGADVTPAAIALRERLEHMLIAPILPSTRPVVLLVEDDDPVRALIDRALRANGFDVVAAASGEEALELEVDAHVDLLLSDVMLPDQNGFEIANRIHARSPHIPIVFMSGYYDQAVAEAAHLDIGSTILQKPFAVADLLAHLRAAYRPRT